MEVTSRGANFFDQELRTFEGRGMAGHFIGKKQGFLDDAGKLSQPSDARRQLWRRRCEPILLWLYRQHSWQSRVHALASLASSIWLWRLTRLDSSRRDEGATGRIHPDQIDGDKNGSVRRRPQEVRSGRRSDVASRRSSRARRTRWCADLVRILRDWFAGNPAAWRPRS